MTAEKSDEGVPPQAGVPAWVDMAPAPAEPPEEWLARPVAFADDEPPPQLVRTVNLLEAPEHDLRGPEDAEGLAEFLVSRAKEGIDDIFSHEDYDTAAGDGEDWARAVAEHQTGIPYTMPAYFYGAQTRVARAIKDGGRYPLVGQCQQSVTTALCLGGWDGGPYGDIGCGTDAQPAAARLGDGWTDVPRVLADWPDDLWEKVTVGSCLFWSASGAAGAGSGHVAMVIRKHPNERKWQLWDTTTSFNDPVVHPTSARGARMLWESHWWPFIPPALAKGQWLFRGVARIDGLGTVKSDVKPRGRARLLLRSRGDGKLLYRSAWMSMEDEGLPISWLLRSLRGAPFHDRIEPTWCINSKSDAPTPSAPDNRPLLDVFCDPKGNARMSWSPAQGLHNRPHQVDWAPPAEIRSAALKGAR